MQGWPIFQLPSTKYTTCNLYILLHQSLECKKEYLPSFNSLSLINLFSEYGWFSCQFKFNSSSVSAWSNIADFLYRMLGVIFLTCFVSYRYHIFYISNRTNQLILRKLTTKLLSFSRVHLKIQVLINLSLFLNPSLSVWLIPWHLLSLHSWYWWNPCVSLSRKGFPAFFPYSLSISRCLSSTCWL